MNYVGWALVAICLGVAAVPAYGQLTGHFRLLPVLSNSMEPHMSRGDLAWVQPKPAGQLRVGDVLVFNSPARGSSPSLRVIHRVTELVDPQQIRPEDRTAAEIYVRTKGDANAFGDLWIASITDDRVWVRTKVIPNLGRPLLAGGRSAQTAGILGAGLLIALFGLRTLRPAVRNNRQSETPLWRPYGLPESAPSTTKAAADSVPLQAPIALGAAAGLLISVGGIAAAVTAVLVDKEITSGNVSSAAVTLELGESTLDIVVSDLLPGETSQRVVELVNTGTTSVGRIQAEVSGGSDPILDPTAGLQLTLDDCTVPWVTGVQDGQPTASCPGVSGNLIPTRPLLGRTDLGLDDLDADVPGATDYLRVQIGLPIEATTSLSGTSATVTVAFLASQREATSR